MKSMVHESLMSEAIELSRRNVAENKGGPFAALIIRNGKVISRGTNLVTVTNDPTAHAEIVAIREACRSLGTFKLEGCEIVTSCEPCPMCLAAIYWARVDKIYYANSREDAARIGFDDGLIYDEIPLPAHARKIPSERILQTMAQTAFDEWEKKTDKVRY